MYGWMRGYLSGNFIQERINQKEEEKVRGIASETFFLFKEKTMHKNVVSQQKTILMHTTLSSASKVQSTLTDKLSPALPLSHAAKTIYKWQLTASRQPSWHLAHLRCRPKSYSIGKHVSSTVTMFGKQIWLYEHNLKIQTWLLQQATSNNLLLFQWTKSLWKHRTNFTQNQTYKHKSKHTEVFAKGSGCFRVKFVETV